MEPSGSSDVSSTDTESTQLLDTIPSSPPPPYEHVLAEVGNRSKEDSRKFIEKRTRMIFDRFSGHSGTGKSSNENSSKQTSEGPTTCLVICNPKGIKSTLAARQEGMQDEASGQVSNTDESSGSQSTDQPKEILIIHKSTKSLYRALAAQWGITCKMSDQCPCLDCQSHYFDCEYDRDNDHEKTDGGLGAGTPMFISEVMHGTACSIL